MSLPSLVEKSGIALNLGLPGFSYAARDSYVRRLR